MYTAQGSAELLVSGSSIEIRSDKLRRSCVHCATESFELARLETVRLVHARRSYSKRTTYTKDGVVLRNVFQMWCTGRALRRCAATSVWCHRYVEKRRIACAARIIRS